MKEFLILLDWVRSIAVVMVVRMVVVAVVVEVRCVHVRCGREVHTVLSPVHTRQSGQWWWWVQLVRLAARAGRENTTATPLTPLTVGTQSAQWPVVKSVNLQHTWNLLIKIQHSIYIYSIISVTTCPWREDDAGVIVIFSFLFQFCCFMLNGDNNSGNTIE